MNIITCEEIGAALDKGKVWKKEVWEEKINAALANQPFLLNYVACRELATELGADGESWLTHEADAMPNQVMLFMLSSLLFIVSDFNQKVPTVGPHLLIKTEGALQPRLVLLAVNPNSTDDELIDMVIDTCRQRDLMEFAVELLFAGKEDQFGDGAAAVPTEGSLPSLIELIKLRVVVDAIDAVTKEADASEIGLNDEE